MKIIPKEIAAMTAFTQHFFQNQKNPNLIVISRTLKHNIYSMYNVYICMQSMLCYSGSIKITKRRKRYEKKNM